MNYTKKLPCHYIEYLTVKPIISPFNDSHFALTKNATEFHVLFVKQPNQSFLKIE